MFAVVGGSLFSEQDATRWQRLRFALTVRASLTLLAIIIIHTYDVFFPPTTDEINLAHPWTHLSVVGNPDGKMGFKGI
jgi:hypothetical protein